MFNNKSNKGKRFIFLKAFKYLLIFVIDLCGSLSSIYKIALNYKILMVSKLYDL